MIQRRVALVLGCLGLTGIGGCATTGSSGCSGAGCGPGLVYIGQRAAAPGAVGGTSILAARFDPVTGGIALIGPAASIPQPTWLEADPDRPVLFSVSETGNDGKSHGGVYSLAIEPSSGKLRVIDRVDSGGGGATNLALDPRSSTVFVANFGGGQVAAIPVDANGSLQPPVSVQTDTGSGPTPRQKGPHAHGVTLDPSGHFLLAPDFGADRIFVYAFNAKTRMLSPAATPTVGLPPGSGPRHLAFTPDGRFAFLVTELTGTVFGYRWDAASGQLTEIERVPLDPAGFTGKRSGAEIAVSRDGRFVYASNRAEDALQVYAIDDATGRLSLQQTISCGGHVPWSFTLDPDGRWLIVSNQASNRVSVFGIDPRSGRLSATANGLTVASPVSVAFTH